MLRKAAAVGLLLVIMASTGTALQIFSLETGQDTYAPGDRVTIRALLISENEPIADHQVELSIAYSPKYNPERAPNGETILNTTFMPLEMTANETRYVNHTWQVPENAAPGSYRVYFIVRNANEDIRVLNTARFNVSDVGQEVRSVQLTDLFFRQGDAIGYSLEGLRVSSNRTANATLTIANVGTVPLDLNVTMEMQYTFQRTKTAFKRYESVTIQPEQQKDVTFVFMPPDEPTTYTPVFKVYDSKGNYLGQRKGRLVVRGNSGSIINAGIGDVSYRQGEPVTLNAELIGPADYSGPINGVTFNYTLKDSKGILMQGRKTVSIGGQVTHINISKPAPRAFANPNMTIYLKKNGRIYDSYHASYSGGTVPEAARTGKDRPWLVAGVLIILIAAAGIIIWRQQA